MVPQRSAYISANTAQLFLKWIFVYVKQSFENNYILSWQLIDMASPSFNTICLFTDVWFSKDPLSFTHAYRCLFINAHVSRADCRPLKTFMFWGWVLMLRTFGCVEFCMSGQLRIMKILNFINLDKQRVHINHVEFKSGFIFVVGPLLHSYFSKL